MSHTGSTFGQKLLRCDASCGASRCFVVRSSRLWEDDDRQGNSESIRLQVHQPSGLDADGHVVRGVTEADRRRLLAGRQNPALHYFY